MLNDFIYAKKKSLFETALNNGQVLDEAIAFIEDTKEIWNHGSYYGGGKSRNILSAPVVNNYIEFTSSLPMQPNSVYISETPVSGIGISSILDPVENFAEYTLHFTTSISFIPITLPENILWANGSMPDIELNTPYELSITATKCNGAFQYKAILVPFKPII